MTAYSATNDLTFFAACNTAKIEGITHTEIISPFFETREQALEFKANSLEEYPDCFTAKYTFEYSLESDPARLELLAKIVKANRQAQLQQDLDSTIGSFSTIQLVRFSKALNRIQKTIDHFNDRVAGGCTQQVVDILGVQLEEIQAAAKNQPA